jgi:hypothetical protein
MPVIRISFARNRFAAELLAGCRHVLLNISHHVDVEREFAEQRRKRRGDPNPVPDFGDNARLVAAALYADWIVDALRRQGATYGQADSQAALLFGDPNEPELPPIDPAPAMPAEWPLPPLPAPLATRAKTADGSPGDLGLPVYSARQMRSVREELDEAIRAISWQQNVRLQNEISAAATNLRDWVSASITAISDDD